MTPATPAAEATMPARGFRPCQRTSYTIIVEGGHTKARVQSMVDRQCTTRYVFPSKCGRRGDEVGACDQEHVARCHITSKSRIITFILSRAGGRWQPLKLILALSRRSRARGSARRLCCNATDNRLTHALHFHCFAKPKFCHFKSQPR